MIELSLSALISPVLAGLSCAVGVYVAMSNRMCVVETKVDNLGEDVKKHNSVVERTYKLESDAATSWKRIDELKERVAKLEDAHGHEQG